MTPSWARELYNEYLDEYEYSEEAGFDGLMLNEHHSTPTCMGATMNLEAAILARITKKPKIVLLGNPLPVFDNPIRLAEELAEIDMISRGRLVSGFVRGTGVESWQANINPVHNRERFEEAHDLVLKTWTTPGPFRWEGKHFQFRYVNPFQVPLQDPHPPVWIPGTGSPETVAFCAETPAIPTSSWRLTWPPPRTCWTTTKKPPDNMVTSPVQSTSATCNAFWWLTPTRRPGR